VQNKEKQKTNNQKIKQIPKTKENGQQQIAYPAKNSERAANQTRSNPRLNRGSMTYDPRLHL